MEALDIALSGIQSAQTRFATSAHNVANLLTKDFRPQRADQVSLASGGSQAIVRQSPTPEQVDLAREVVDQIQARTQFLGSARVAGVASEMQGSLIDLFA